MENFYVQLFQLNENEIEQFTKIYSKLKNLYSELYKDKSLPFKEEYFIKASIFTLYTNLKKTKEYTENEYNSYLEKLYTPYKEKLFFGKDNSPLLSLINVLKAIKGIISYPQIRNDPELVLPNKILDQYSQGRDYSRKLNEFFLHFLENTVNNLKLKKTIWAAFIYIRSKLYPNSNNLLEGYCLLVYIFNILATKISIEYFPLTLKITEENKNEIIQKIVFQISKIDKNLIEQANYSQVQIELNQANIEKLDYSNSDKYTEIFYTKYKNEFILKSDIFDERILYYEIFTKTLSSPKKINQFLQPTNIVSCARQLFSLPSENNHSISNNFYQNKTLNNLVSMTPFTRVVTLKQWAKNYIADYEPNFVLNLQEKYCPQYEYNKNLKPISKYINNILTDKFEKLISFYKVKLFTNIEERTKLCLKFIQNLIQKDENIFNEEFCSMLLYNEIFAKAMIAISFEIVLFIEDIEEIPFNKIYESIDLDIYDFWKIINPTKNNSIIFHKEIKEHLDEIEYQILSFLMWRNPSTKFKDDIKNLFNQDMNEQLKTAIEKLSDFEFNYQSLFLLHNKNDFCLDFNKKEEDYKLDIFKNIRNYIKSYPYLNGVSIVLRRIISYCNLLNKKIFNCLGLSDEIAIESEKFLKSILVNEEYIKILFQHHIDQFVICVIITILKINNLFKEDDNTIHIQNNIDLRPKISLSVIKNIYQRSKQDETNILQKIFTHVKIDNNKYISLIDFYNNTFVKTFESFITDFKKEKESLEENESYPIKKRKLSDGILSYSNKNTENTHKSSYKDILLIKSAFSNKVENYEAMRKKIENTRTNSFFGINYNQNVVKRTQRLKEIYPVIITFETSSLNTNKRTNQLLRRTFGFGSLFTHQSQQSTPDFKKSN